MVEENESSGTERPEEQSQTSGSNQRGGMSKVAQHMLDNKVDTALWLTRAITLFFTISYFLPFFSSSESSYQKALISNAATSALRLHQRVRGVTLSREFIAQLVTEDSAHYLLYSLTFIVCSPITIVLAPIALFAVLHFASNSLALFDVLGENNALAPRFLISLVEFQQRNILRGAAFIEIFLMPITILNVFFGRVNLASPFIYYQFLVMRYTSRRNPYTRTMFYELRISAEMLANKPSCPTIVKNLIYRATGLVSRMAPAMVQQE